MTIRADVKCYYCGHISGQVEGDPDNPRAAWTFRPAQEQSARAAFVRNAIRCGRCGGPVFLDEFETVRARPYSEERPAVSASR